MTTLELPHEIKVSSGPITNRNSEKTQTLFPSLFWESILLGNFEVEGTLNIITVVLEAQGKKVGDMIWWSYLTTISMSNTFSHQEGPKRQLIWNPTKEARILWMTRLPIAHNIYRLQVLNAARPPQDHGMIPDRRILWFPDFTNQVTLFTSVTPSRYISCYSSSRIFSGLWFVSTCHAGLQGTNVLAQPSHWEASRNSLRSLHCTLNCCPFYLSDRLLTINFTNWKTFILSLCHNSLKTIWFLSRALNMLYFYVL